MESCTSVYFDIIKSCSNMLNFCVHINFKLVIIFFVSFGQEKVNKDEDNDDEDDCRRESLLPIYSHSPRGLLLKEA